MQGLPAGGPCFCFASDIGGWVAGGGGMSAGGGGPVLYLLLYLVLYLFEGLKRQEQVILLTVDSD